VPLSDIQRDILRLLAANRNPESYVGGSTPLNRLSQRFSGDVDVFHDREERVAAAAEQDGQLLLASRYQLRWTRREPAIYTAVVSDSRESTRLEWLADSDFRFFPTIPDDTFGYILHPVDLATNKVMAAAGRREVRDLVDLVLIHEKVLPLAAAIWAAVEKSPGFTPEGLIAEIRRNANYPLAEWRSLDTSEPLDPATIMSKLRAALDEAESFVIRMPTDRVGMVFIEHDRVVQPDPDRLAQYHAHVCQRRGHWPGNAEIASAMLQRYGVRPENR
jgi:hypothetical protein